MPYDEILYEVKDRVAVITLNRPDRMNALTRKTHSELADAINTADEDKEVRVIVFTGAGRGFCSGDDVRDIFLNPDVQEAYNRELRVGMLQGAPLGGGCAGLLRINTPTIAAVNGAAVGYGCDITLMCHMRVASDKARFGEVFLRVGLMPDDGLLLLPRLIGLAKTYEMVLTADIIDAAEAERIGLVNKVVPHDQLMDETLALAHKIASRAPVAARLAIADIRRGLNWNFEEYKRWHDQAYMFCMETEDHIEGAKAFAEKREPDFKGK